MGTNVHVDRAQDIVDEMMRGSYGDSASERLGAMPGKLLGTVGEELAARYLEARGFSVIERNYRCSEGEADLVVLDPNTNEVVLVEVKTRRVPDAADIFPEEAVTPFKQRRYRRIAALFAMERYPCPAIRFDVIAVQLRDDGTGSLRHSFGTFDWEAA